MEERFTRELQPFSAVWQRLSAPALPPEEDEAQRLARHIRDSALRHRGWQSVAALRPRAGELRQELRALQLEHFLLTGDSAPEPRSSAALRPGLAGLRQLYWWESRAAADLLRSAALSAGGTQKLYLQLGQAASERAGQLREIIGRALG